MRDSAVVDDAARPARPIHTTLIGTTAGAAATELTGESGAGVVVAQYRPVEGISVRIADLTRIRRVRCPSRDVVVSNVAEALAAGIEQTTLPCRTAITAATVLIAVRPAGDIAQPGRPIESVSGRVADLTDVVRVDRVPRNRIAIDLTAAVLT